MNIILIFENYSYVIDFFFQLNRVYIIFDQPTAVSMIKIWNYSKTANRGAKDIAVSQFRYR